MTTATVGDLVAAPAVLSAETGVRLAVEPGYPQAAMIGAVACSPDEADMTGCNDPMGFDRLVRIAQGTPIGYLPEIARDVLAGHWAT